MNPLTLPSGARPAALPHATRAEAAAWVARLHSSNRSRALEAGFKRWLEADPSHAAAFELATEAWEIGGSIPRGALPRIADPFQERRLLRPLVAMAATLSGVIIAAWLYLDHEAPAIATAVGEQRILNLEDGSRIALNTDTRLFVKLEPSRRSVELERGEALFDVARDPNRPFTVMAGGRAVTALGTSFVVRHESTGTTTVTLVEGKVRVQSALSSEEDEQAPAKRESGSAVFTRVPKDERVTLLPGQRLVLADAGPPRLEQPQLDEVTAWRRGEVIFDKTEMQAAAEEMNRYSLIELVIEDPRAARIPVSGVFRAGDSLRFARAVAETYHLQVDQQDRRIVIR